MEKDMPNKTATKTVKAAKTVKSRAGASTTRTLKKPFAAKKSVTGKKPVVTKPSTKKPTVKKPVNPTVHVPVAPPQADQAAVVQQPQATEADKLWAEIRFRPIEMFGLPNQIVEQHATPFPADPNKLFLTIRSSAVLPSLEATCRDLTVELADRFIIVSRPVVVPVVPNFPGAPLPPRR
jgi:hypothetical protein